MNRPTLVTIQTLVMMGPYLTNCGKFLDASAIFGITVRLAQSIGCKYQALRSHTTLIRSDMASAPRSQPIEPSSASQGDGNTQEYMVVDAAHGSALFHGAREAFGNF